MPREPMLPENVIAHLARQIAPRFADDTAMMICRTQVKWLLEATLPNGVTLGDAVRAYLALEERVTYEHSVELLHWPDGYWMDETHHGPTLAAAILAAAEVPDAG